MKALLETLLATTALAIVVSSSPASAQVYGDRWRNPALGAFAQSGPLTAQQRRDLARAQIGDGRVHSPNPAFDVYDTQGRYVGSDPDPFIRNELARNPPNRND
ncbi:MAG TPA: hypothetical protein VFB68_14580 [Xanthobacteraceae bacterium]|nr:hypothetical protein [Xanthobacteraceae bacterium]